jgi:hypothetical protein
MKLTRTLMTRLTGLVAPSRCGCAPIVDGGPRDVNVRSQPSGAKVTIFDKKGKEVSVQTTPFIVSLKRGASYFLGHKFTLKFELPGYQTTEAQVNAILNCWYAGDLIFGGLLGILIIDPDTGAMWTLSPTEVEQALPQAQAGMLKRGEGICVMLKSEATPAEIGTMKPVTLQ